MTGTLRGCFGIPAGKRNDARVAGRLGVSRPPVYLLSKVHSTWLLRVDPFIGFTLSGRCLNLLTAGLKLKTEA